MSYTQWVSNGTNVSYVPKEKDTGEVITPFTTTAPGGVPNSSYAPSTYVLAASGAWIPQTVGTSSSEVRRPTAYTLLTSNPSPYFEATDTSLVYDSDTNHLTTNGRFELQGLSAQNDASFKFSSFQTKAQTWTSATLNISRNYASTRWTSGTEARYYLSTDGGTNWTLLLTDDYDNDPVTVTIFSHTLATANPSSLSNYQVKVEIDAFSSGALGSVGVLDLQLYDIWIEGIYTVSGGTGTVTSITTTGANGVTISGGSTQTITTSGTFALALGNITPTSISTGTGSFSGDVEFAASIKSPNGSNSPVTIVPDGTGDLHVNADSLRLGDNNADATIATNGTGDLILTTHEGSATQGVIRLYDGANGNITLTPNGTGQVQVGSDQVVTLTASQTLTNKTLSSNSVWNGNVIGSAYGGAGTVNGILKANGSGTVSAASAGTDYVTSVSVTSPVSNTGTSANPTIALASGYGDTQNPYASKTANYFLASPNGSAGVPTFRAIVAADIPTLNQNTTGTAANITATSNTTLTTLSSLVSIGTITTGTWNASAIGVAYGGTGLTTLTAGRIPYGNGTSAFGSSANLFWDSTNSRLGIGTATPADKLQIAAGRILLDQDYQLTWQNAGTNRARMYGDSGNNIIFENGSTNTERMRITSAGQLIIGNGSAVASPSGGTLRGTDGSGTDIAGASLTIQAGRGTGTGAGGSLLFFTAAASGTTGSSLNTATEKMRLDASGNLGLGTSSPISKLHVYTAATNKLTLDSPTANDNRLDFAKVGTVKWSMYSPANSNDLRMYDHQTVGDVVTFQSGGNVGIGTTTPSQKLEVANGYSLFGGLRINGADASVNQIWQSNSGTNLGIMANGGAILFGQTSSEKMRLDASGNLGIGGTASSGTRLYVVGSNTTSNTSIPIYANQVYGNTGVSSAALRLNLNDGAGGCYLYGYSGGAGFMHNAEYLAGTGWTARSTFASIMETTSSGFSFYLNSSLTAGNTFTPSEQMRLTSTGLGIGTSSPSAGLHISKAFGSQLRIQEAGGTYFDIACGGRFDIKNGSGTTIVSIAQSGSPVGTMLNLDSSGNLGVGTSSPTNKLQVNGVMVGNNASGSYTKGFGGILTTTSTSTPTGGSSGDFTLIY